MKLHLPKTLFCAVLACMVAPAMAEDLTIAGTEVTWTTGTSYDNVTIETADGTAGNLKLTEGESGNNAVYTINGVLTMGAGTTVGTTGTANNNYIGLSVGSISVTQEDAATAGTAAINLGGWTNLNVAESINVSNNMTLTIKGAAIRQSVEESGEVTKVKAINLTNGTLKVTYWGGLYADTVTMDNATLSNEQDSNFYINTVEITGNSTLSSTNNSEIGVVNVRGGSSLSGAFKASNINVASNATLNATVTADSVTVAGKLQGSVTGKVILKDGSSFVASGGSSSLKATDGIELDGGTITIGGFTGGDNGSVTGKITGTADTLKLTSIYNTGTIKGWTENDYVAETKLTKVNQWQSEGSKALKFDAESNLSNGGELKAWGAAENEVSFVVEKGTAGLEIAFISLTADQDYSIENNLTVANGNTAGVVLSFDNGSIALNGDLAVHSQFTVKGGQNITMNGKVTVDEGKVITVAADTTLALSDTATLVYAGTAPVVEGATTYTVDMLGNKTELTGELADVGTNFFKRTETGQSVQIFGGEGTLPSDVKIHAFNDLLDVNDGSFVANYTDYSTLYVTESGTTTSTAAAVSASHGSALETVRILKNVASLKADSNVALGLADSATIGDLTVEGGSVTSSQRGGVSNLKLTNGSYTATGGDNGTGVITGKITINKGGVLKLTLKDSLGWGNTKTDTLTMQGEAGNIAELQLKARQTVATAVNLNGNTLISTTEDADASSDDRAGLDLYGGKVTVQGTNNVNETALRIRSDGDATIEIDSGAAFTQKGLIYEYSYYSNHGTLNKNGNGTLRIEGTSDFGDATIKANAGKVELAGKAVAGKYQADGGELVIEALDGGESHTLNGLSATGGTITLKNGANVSSASDVTVENASLSVGGQNTVTGNVSVSATGTLVIGAGATGTRGDALNVVGTLTLADGSTVDVSNLASLTETEIVLATATTISDLSNITLTGVKEGYTAALSVAETTYSSAVEAKSLVMTLTSISPVTPTTLTATTVVEYSGGVLKINVSESLDGLDGKDFNVLVGDAVWENIVTAMSGVEGGVYNNATITLNGQALTDFGTVSFNGYSGTGTKGEYYVAYIPEPATATLSLLALAALAARRRRK